MVNYLHANGLKSVFWISRYQMTTNYTNIYNPGLGTNVYVGSYTPALLASDVQTIHGWGADGIAVDAVNYDAVNTYNQAIEYSAPITIFTTVEGWQTNGAPNPEAGSGINMTPFYIDYSGIDKRSLVEAVVNCTEFGGNDFLTCNPPDGPYTNQVQAELQMESMVFTHTNISTWVRPGHQLNACHMDVYNTTNWLATNAMSLIAMESYNFFISGFYGNGPNATAPVMQIFTNATWRAIWKDPLVKMALPVANGVWVKRLSAPNTYAVCLWNNSTNAALNINIPLTQIAPEFTGFVTVEDVMNQTMYSTNITNFTYNSLPPMATRMFLFNGKNQNFVYVYTPPAGQVLTNTLVAGYWLGEGSGVTNYDRTTNGAYALNGNVSWTTRGSSNALSVTASSYVYVAPNSSPNSGWNAVAAQPKTVAEWVYMTNNQAYAGLAAKDSFSGGWELRTFYTNLCVTLPSVGDYYATASVIPLNAWFHAAMVYNGSNSIAFYTNGVFCQSVATSAEVLDTNDIPRIASVKNGASPLTGAVQDLRIYLGAMTATDIGNIYSNVPSSTGTNGYWTCYPITFHVTNGVPYLTTP